MIDFVPADIIKKIIDNQRKQVEIEKMVNTNEIAAEEEIQWPETHKEDIDHRQV